MALTNPTASGELLFFAPAVGFVKAMKEVPPRRRYSDRKSTRLNSSHLGISYAVFCLKKKKVEMLIVRELGTSRLEEENCAMRLTVNVRSCIAKHTGTSKDLL